MLLLIRPDRNMSCTIKKNVSGHKDRIGKNTVVNTVTFVFGRAMTAMEADEHENALKMFDAVVDLDPSFAEGWNKRATLHYIMGNYKASFEDIQKVLELEPRHFGALQGRFFLMF